MSDVTLSIVVPTKGRPTLARALESVAGQLGEGDEMLVKCRTTRWGNATRDELVPKATGSHLWWLDDDDMAAPDALDTIRRHVSEDPGTIHVFRMRYENERKPGWPIVLWQAPEFRLCNVGGPMCVVPNVREALGEWAHDLTYTEAGPGACGDWHFLSRTCELLDRDPVFHEEIVARIRVPA